MGVVALPPRQLQNAPPQRQRLGGAGLHTPRRQERPSPRAGGGPQCRPGLRSPAGWEEFGSQQRPRCLAARGRQCLRYALYGPWKADLWPALAARTARTANSCKRAAVFDTTSGCAAARLEARWPHPEAGVTVWCSPRKQAEGPTAA